MSQSRFFIVFILIGVYSPSLCRAQSMDETLRQSANAVKSMHDNRAWVDLKNASTGEEAYFIDHDSYVSCANEKCASVLPGFILSSGVTLKFEASPGGFRGEASHTDGTGVVFHYDSSKGGMQEKAPMYR